MNDATGAVLLRTFGYNELMFKQTVTGSFVGACAYFTAPQTSQRSEQFIYSLSVSDHAVLFP